MKNLITSRLQYRTPKTGNSFTEQKEASWIPSDFCSHLFIALQPIFNRHRKIFGYEALSRSGWDNQFTDDLQSATQIMIGDWMLDTPNRLTGESAIFLNCAREDLVGGLLTLLPAPTVLEVLETVEADEEVIAACRRLKALGHQIALDDFQLCEEMEGLIELADYVKVDFRLSSQEERSEILSYLRGKPILLIAEKIETQEEFEAAVADGFQLFQGYYLARPALFSKRSIPPS